MIAWPRLVAAAFAALVGLALLPSEVAGQALRLEAKRTSPGSKYEYFGRSLAMSDETLFAGSPFEDVGGALSRGVVYVYTRDSGAWTLRQELVASDGGPGHQFGGALAASGDWLAASAKTLGTSYDDSVYLYQRDSSGVWIQRQKLAAPDASTGDDFGSSLSMSGDTLAVGAREDDIDGNLDQGSVYVYARVGATWALQQKIRAATGAAFRRFGTVSISGATLLVGGRPNGDNGSAYVFVRQGTTWIEQAHLLPEGSGPNHSFGWAVALRGDTAVVLGAKDNPHGNGLQISARVYGRQGSTWTLQQILAAPEGPGTVGDSWTSATLALTDTRLIVGGPSAPHGWAEYPTRYTGAVYVFGGPAPYFSWQRIVASDAQSGALFGYVAAAGDVLAVGAPFDEGPAYPNRGSAYLFSSLPTSNEPPVLSPNISATAVTETSATVHAELLSIGGAPLIDQGFLFSKTAENPNPTWGNAITVTTPFVVGPYSTTLTSLSPGTSYTVRAFAKSVVGSTHGPTLLVTTRPLAALSIADVAVTEGNTGSGSSNAVFTVSLSSPRDQTVTVSAGTSAGTATAFEDYLPVGPTVLTFPPGVTSQTFSVPVLGDDILESNETFLVTLSNPTVVPIDRGVAVGTIVNDELPTRAFAGIHGSDANDCAVPTSPCRSIAAALTQVATDGEIIILASGEYETGPLTIYKGVKVTAPSGTVAFIRQPITVNAPGGRVVFRGLTMKGTGAGDGITLTAAALLSIEDSTIDRWNNGVALSGASGSRVAISNTVLRANAAGVQLTAAGLTSVSIEGSRFEGNGAGIDASGGSFFVRDSTFVNNTAGVSAGQSTVDVQRAEFFLNAAGLTSLSGATIRIGRSYVFANDLGLTSSGGGTLQSSGTNVIRGNVTNLTGTIGSVPEQ